MKKIDNNSNNESEIIWIEKSFPINYSEIYYNYNIIYISIAWLIIKVLFQDNKLLEQIEEKYTIINENEIDNIMNLPIFIYHWWEKIAKWFIDRKSNICEIKWNWFWKFKSELVWYISDLIWLVPVHGSAIKSNEIWWTLMIAWRNWWKSTALLNIANILNWWNILSDDWINIIKDEKWVLLKSWDPTISFDNKTIIENKSIDWLQKNEFINRTNYRKICIPIEDWFNWKYLNNDFYLDKVILLSTSTSSLVTKIVNYKYIWDFIINSTYHYPYTSSEIKNKHKNFWENNLVDKPVYVYNRNYSSDIVNWFKRLVDYIIKD